MSNENVIFIGIGRIRDQIILASVFDRISSNEKNEVETSFQNFLLDALSRFGPGSREKRHFSEGTMFMLADRELNCIYAIAARGKGYPERIANACLAEVGAAIQANGEDKSLNTVNRAGALNRTLRQPLKELMDKYDKPQNVDKTSEVAGKVDQVKGVMQDNISKVLATHANISELEQKTENLSQNAEQFHRSAHDMKRMMWLQKMKMTVILVLVGAALLGYIILMIVQLVK
eukprot:GHVO01003915.1.p1 GENE.GHVO01003915.1~~GHVO01003915.1.p1  ORF type:complete len:232 (+),score=38.24 GHVO01003915.1:26-721(+)